MLISICSVTYYRKACVKEWLTNLDNSLEHDKFDYEILIHDNNSQDGTFDFLEDFAKDKDYIKVNKTSENIGKPRALNESFSKCSGEYFVSSDSDIVVKPGWTTELVSIMQEHDNIGLLSPFYEHNCNDPFTEYSKVKNLMGDLDLFYFQKHFGCNVAGGFIIMPAKVFWNVGAYNVQGVYGGNDARLNLAMVDKGYECAYTSRAYVEHLPPSASLTDYESWKKGVLIELRKDNSYEVSKGFWD